MQTTTEKLQAIATQIESQNVPNCWVGDYSAEDKTPTLHVELWRNHCLSDLIGDIHLLNVICEGDGHFSLQLPNPDAWRVGSDGRLYRH